MIWIFLFATLVAIIGYHVVTISTKQRWIKSYQVMSGSLIALVFVGLIFYPYPIMIKLSLGIIGLITLVSYGIKWMYHSNEPFSSFGKIVLSGVILGTVLMTGLVGVLYLTEGMQYGYQILLFVMVYCAILGLKLMLQFAYVKPVHLVIIIGIMWILQTNFNLVRFYTRNILVTSDNLFQHTTLYYPDISEYEFSDEYLVKTLELVDTYEGIRGDIFYHNDVMYLHRGYCSLWEYQEYRFVQLTEYQDEHCVLYLTEQDIYFESEELFYQFDGNRLEPVDTLPEEASTLDQIEDVTLPIQLHTFDPIFVIDDDLGVSSVVYHDMAKNKSGGYYFFYNLEENTIYQYQLSDWTFSIKDVFHLQSNLFFLLFWLLPVSLGFKRKT